ncbi:MAG: BatD family protein [Bacteroidia bacterium]|nr:BatD family protein [Bacteroidia bacterium]
MCFSLVWRNTYMRGAFCKILFLLSYTACLAQKFEAVVSSRQVQAGQMFEVRFTSTGMMTSFSPPSFKDFEVVGGPNQSSSIQIINGIINQSQSISYYLVARKEGKYTIGSASANVDGQRMSTNPITIEVLPGGSPSNSGNLSQNQQPQDFSDQKFEADGRDYFIRTILSKNKCMKGEFVIVSQRIYSKHPIVSIEKFDPPSYEGVWSQTLQTTSGNQLQTEVLNGEQYYSFEIFRHQVSPTQAGKIVFKPIEGTIVIRKAYQGKPRNIWEQFFGTQSYQDFRVQVKSNAVELNVMELPVTGRPDNFNGAIGEFQIRSDISRKELKQNEALNLKIIISGKGNLQTVEPSKPELPEGFELYDPKVTEYASSKVFDYLIIPRAEGEYTIVVPPFSYFSLEKKQYVTIPALEYPIKVLPGTGGTTPQVFQSQQLQQEIPASDEDIRYIKKFPFEVQKQSERFTGSGWFWMMYGLPWLGFAVLLFVMNRRKQSMLNPEEFMFRRASRSAYRMLELANKEKSASEHEKFYLYVMQGMQHYLCAKLKIGLSEFSSSHVFEKLTQNGVTKETAQKWIDLYSLAEQARYAPGINISGKDEFLNEVKTILNKTEKEFKA